MYLLLFDTSLVAIAIQTSILPIRLETVCHALRKQLFAGIIFPCVLTYKLKSVLNELQWHALLNEPVCRLYIAFLREINGDNGCNRWLLCGGYAALYTKA